MYRYKNIIIVLFFIFSCIDGKNHNSVVGAWKGENNNSTLIMNIDNDKSEETISSEMNLLPLSLLRYQNMLNSDMPELHKLAAKRIYFEGITDNRITRLVLFRIVHPAPRTDKDTKKWLKKSLCNTCRGYGSRKN